MSKFPVTTDLLRAGAKEGNELLFLGSLLAVLFLAALAAAYFALVGP
jgi:hypothetical protein